MLSKESDQTVQAYRAGIHSLRIAALFTVSYRIGDKCRHFVWQILMEHGYAHVNQGFILRRSQ